MGRIYESFSILLFWGIIIGFLVFSASTSDSPKGYEGPECGANYPLAC